jgi:hypothetical protein
MTTKGQSICEKIVERLPKRELWKSTDDINYTVEPKISVNYLTECGGDLAPRTGRPLWIIGGTAFYCAYSIDHDSSVMANIGSSISTGNVCWLNSIESDQLNKIFELVCSKDPTTITPDEVDNIINN